jgi:acetolactate synthase I/II/III large subunit
MDPKTPNVSQSIVKMLESAGVDALFSGSGQGSGEILFAFAESKKIKTIMVRHEQAASFMACGYAMYQNKLGLCNAQGGPGSFNVVSGLGVAMSDSLPVMSIASYAPKKWRGLGDLGEVTGLSRTPDGPKMYEACTKKAFIVETPDEAPDILEEALNTAFEGRPGPVHVDLPYDVAAAPATNMREIKLTVKQVAPLPKTVDVWADFLSRAIAAGKKIVLFVGYGCVRNDAGQELRRFVERFQIPFIHTMDAKGLLGDNHPLSLGMSGVSGDPGAKKAFQEADVFLAFGNSFAKWQTWKFEPGILDKKIVMHMNIAREEIGKVYPTEFAMVADCKLGIAALYEALDKKVGKVAPRVLVPDKIYLKPIEKKGPRMNPGELSLKLGTLLPAKAIVLGDAGAHMIWLAAYMQLDKDQRYKNPGSFGPMASHVNAALGVQLANPDRRVIVGCGDGDYQMSGFELMTAVQHKVPIIWIIFNNGEFNIIKLFNLVAHGKEVFNHFLNPDFAKYAEACGANGFHVETLGDFEKAFNTALASDRPSLIDVAIDPDAVMPFKFFDQK